VDRARPILEGDAGSRPHGLEAPSVEAEGATGGDGQERPGGEGHEVVHLRAGEPFGLGELQEALPVVAEGAAFGAHPDVARGVLGDAGGGEVRQPLVGAVGLEAVGALGGQGDSQGQDRPEGPAPPGEEAQGAEER
jgi:hypothetical protein